MELRAEVVIHAPAQAAWALIGERFGHIGEWASPITASALDGELGVGALRTCHVAGFGPVRPGVIQERLVAFDPESRSFAYEAAAGMPGFIEYAINRWSVHQHGEDRCTVRTHATLRLGGLARLLGFAMKWRMAKNGAGVLEELKHHVEHGRPHPRKLDSLHRTAPSGKVPAHPGKV